MVTQQNEPEIEIDSNDAIGIPEELKELQTELINLNTKLVFAVATCECDKKENCEIYTNSKEIAKILKKMQDMITITTRRGKKKSKK